MVFLSERSEPKDLSQMPNKPHIAPKLFRFTYFPKNTSATSLESHTFKTKDLKPFRFTHFQKKGRGRVPLSNIQPQTSNLCSSLSPLYSALTRFALLNSFRICTYKKGGGEGDISSTSHRSRVASLITGARSALYFGLTWEKNMDRREVIRVALRTLGRNKLRTALTLLGITIGISAVICTVAIGQGGQ